MYDVCIVGAGITGITAASVLAREMNKKVIIVEKREHIGGNCYDYYNGVGILVHKYGPHIFHTKYKKVWDYLSNFTKWLPYTHKVLAFVDGKLVSFPVNIKTLEQLFERHFTEGEMQSWVEKNRVPIEKPKNAEDMVVARMGRFLYETFFKNYTLKQWGIEAKKLSPDVTARIPIRFNRDDRYFTDPYQGIPKDGYTKMFERMLNHKNIELVLNTNYKNVINDIKFNKMVYTGPIDHFFDYQFGPLPYRSLNFAFKTLNQQWFQPVAVVNYPNEFDFTRITEFKHITGQKHSQTSICYEYPQDHVIDKNVPCYPIPKKETQEMYEKYKNRAKKLKTVFFIGRLAEYKYLNMDVCVKRVIESIKMI